MSAYFPLTSLPTDTLTRTVQFLTGFDMLQLSHVSRYFYHDVLADNSRAWRRLTATAAHADRSTPPPNRIDEYPSQPCHALAGLSIALTDKHKYFARRSIRFHGTPSNVVFGVNRGSAITTPSLLDLAANGSFSIDMSFALLPDVDGRTHAGGALLASQSVPVVENRWAKHHNLIIYIDTKRNLSCSVVKSKPVVARLEFLRWYHLVLVVEGPREPALMDDPTTFFTQRVFLDGEVVDTVSGPLHPMWPYLTDMQLGTGYFPGGPGFSWHALNGTIDECRFWKGVLEEAEVPRLSRTDHHGQMLDAECMWSMRDVDAEAIGGRVSLVSCTRPVERVCTNLRTREVIREEMIPRRTPPIASPRA